MRKLAIAAIVGLSVFATAVPASASTDGYRVWLATQGVTPYPAMVKAGKAVCQAKDRGVSWNRIVATGVNSGLDDHTLGAIVVGAVYELCPRHTNSFERWLDS